MDTTLWHVITTATAEKHGIDFDGPYDLTAAQVAAMADSSHESARAARQAARDAGGAWIICPDDGGSAWCEWRSGDAVRRGVGDGHDHGKIWEIDGNLTLVGWLGGVATWTEMGGLELDSGECHECDRIAAETAHSGADNDDE